MTTILSLTKPASLLAVRELRTALDETMQKLGFAETLNGRFLLAMSEVASNLVRHPASKPSKIKIELRRTPSEWELAICDNGPAFTEINRHTSFSADETPKLGEGGMGLYILVQNFPSWKYLPADENADGWNQFIICTNIGSASNTKPHIVLVDDDPVLRSVYALYLSDMANLSEFDSAVEALPFVIKHGPDLIISDIRMPDMDGLEFRRQLQKSEEADTTPFIFLTGSNHKDTQDEASGLSIDDYIVKPVNQQNLLGVVNRVLRRNRDLKARLGDRLDDEITRALAPRFRQPIAGYDAAVAYKAAQVGGGDIMLNWPVEDGHLLVLADIMGHDEKAKFFAHALSGYIYGVVTAHSDEASPARLLTAVNNLFLNDALMSLSLATAVAVYLHADGRCFLASAGHPLSTMICQGTARDIKASGPLLGLTSDPGYVETEYLLTPGDRLVILSDGILEAGRHAESTSLSLTNELLSTQPGTSTSDMADGYLRIASERSAGMLGDDATAIVMERC